MKKELSSFMKGLDFSVAAPEAEEDEEELEASEDEDEQEEQQETDEEEDLDAAEESEEDEDVDMSANEPVDEAKAKPARSASPEIEGFVKKSGLSAVQPSSDASIFVSNSTDAKRCVASLRPRLTPEHTAGTAVVQHSACRTARLRTNGTTAPFPSSRSSVPRQFASVTIPNSGYNGNVNRQRQGSFQKLVDIRQIHRRRCLLEAGSTRWYTSRQAVSLDLACPGKSIAQDG